MSPAPEAGARPPGPPGGRLARRLLPAAVVVPLLYWLELIGERAGWYGQTTGAILVAVANAAFLVTLIVASARWIDRSYGRQLQAERALRDVNRTKAENAAFLAAIVQASNDAIIGRTLHGTIRSWNPAAERMYGYSAPEAIGRPITMLVPAEAPDDISEMTRRVAGGDVLRGVETVRARKDGARIEVSLTLSPIYDDASQVVGVSAITRDITAGKQGEATLRSALRFTQQIVDSLGEGLAVYDRNLRFVVFNPEMERITGLRAHDVIGAHPAELLSGYDAHPMKGVLDRALAGEVVRREAVEIAGPAVPEPRWVTDDHVPLRTPDGEIAGVIVTSRDITQRRRAEDQLRAHAVRLQVLADASQAFAAVGHDYQAVLDEVVRCIGVELADSCCIRLLSDDGERLEPAALYAADPDVVEAMRALAGRLPAAGANPGVMSEVLRSGRAVFTPVMHPGPLPSGIPPDLRPLFERFAPHSEIVVPLHVQGRVIGVLSVARYQHDRPAFVDGDFRLAQDLASRAALAINTARLFKQLARELAERTRTEDALRVSKAQLTEAQHIARIGSWRFVPNGPFILSDEMYELHELPRDVVPTFEALSANVHPDDRRLGDALQAALASGSRQFTSAYRVPWPDGPLRQMLALGTINRDTDGRLIDVVGTVQDVTERALAEEALRASEAMYRTLFDAAPVCILVADAEDLRYVTVNDATCQVFGETREQMLSMTIPDHIHPVDLAALPSWMEGVKTGGQMRREWRMVRRDGSVFFLDGVTTLLPDGRVLGLAHDITALKRAEDEGRQASRDLLDAQERTAFALEAARIGVWELDLETNHLVWSGVMADLFGRALNDFSGTRGDALQYVHADDRGALQAAMTRAADAGELNVEYRAIWPDGSVHRLRAIGRVHASDRGERRRLHGVQMDITEQRSLEAQLRQAQKMEAIGQLAGGVAHDFNNLLTAILGYARFLGEDLIEDRQKRDLQEIIKAADRAALLTRQLLTFSRRQVMELTAVNVNTMIGGTLNMLQRLIGEHIVITTLLDPALRTVRADRGQLEQIVMNLAVNARDAMPGGGTLAIETANVRLDDHVRRDTGVKPGPFVRLRVTDSGTGMTDEIKSRIFEPFFTTKDRDRGTGLGLSTVYGIVSQSGGYLTVDSEVGRGSSFNVHLPVDASDEASPDRPPAAAARGGTEVVLLVEDEAAVRLLVRTILARAGYTVVDTGTAAGAVAEFERLGRGVDLLVTDVVMPGGTGVDLCRRLLSLSPELRVLFMSGYSGWTTCDRSQIDPGALFLEKPFSADSLLRLAREALDR